MYVSDVKSGTQNAGLSEFQVYLVDPSIITASTSRYLPILPPVTVSVKVPSKNSHRARHARDFTAEA
jgi:hypothetical protein